MENNNSGKVSVDVSIELSKTDLLDFINDGQENEALIDRYLETLVNKMDARLNNQLETTFSFAVAADCMTSNLEDSVTTTVYEDESGEWKIVETLEYNLKDRVSDVYRSVVEEMSNDWSWADQEEEADSDEE